MTYRIDNKARRYVKYGFMSFAKSIGNIYGKKIMSATSKLNQSKYGNMLKSKGNEFGNIAGKKILTKSAEATGDLIESTIANEITSFKTKKYEKIPEEKEIITPSDRRRQILNDLRFFNIKWDTIKLLIR